MSIKIRHCSDHNTWTEKNEHLYWGSFFLGTKQIVFESVYYSYQQKGYRYCFVPRDFVLEFKIINQRRKRISIFYHQSYGSSLRRIFNMSVIVLLMIFNEVF